MCDFTGKEWVYRFPVIVSAKDASQLLIIIKISSTRRESEAEAIFETIQD